MGQNLCQQVNIEKCYCCVGDIPIPQGNFIDDLSRDLSKQDGENTARRQDSSPDKINNSEKERSQDQNNEFEEGLREEDVFLNTGVLDRLNQLRSMFQQVDTPKEIYLTVDKAWQQELKVQGEDIRNFYKKHKENKYERTGNDNRKCQILFSQHIPIFGKYYFEIEIQAFNTEKDTEFIIGVLDYLQGVKKVHSKKLNIEESFIFKTKEKPQGNKIVLKLEIDRENNRLAYYVNNKLKLQNTKSTLLKQANEATEMMSLAPYIQTMSVGFVFSWRIMPMQRSSGYKMSTIIQEESSIRATS